VHHYQTKLLPTVENDLDEIINYYTINVGVHIAAQFLDEFEQQLQTLKRDPFFQTRYNEVRCLAVGKFPFLIHYTADEKDKMVWIHGVIHTSRNPTDKWIY
jgi:plasmid stabilization system protein ParE